MTKPKRHQFLHPSTLIDRLQHRHNTSQSSTFESPTIYSEAIDRIKTLETAMEKDDLFVCDNCGGFSYFCGMDHGRCHRHEEEE